MTHSTNFIEVSWRVRDLSPEPFAVEEIDPPCTDLLYLFGATAAPSLYGWLSEDSRRHLVILDEAQPLANLLAENLPPRISLHLIEERTFAELYATFAGAQAQVEASPSYRQKYPGRLEQLRERILGGAAQAATIVDEFLGASTEFYSNFFRNLPLLSQANDGAKLFGKFEGVPAIICGAGPSLDRVEIPTEGALIFGPGSSLNALSHRGILPHFGAGIDPYPSQFQRLCTNAAFEVPIFYRNRWHHETLKICHGPRIFLRGVGGYPIATWFEEQMGITGETLDEGHNVVNLCLDIARALGCSPIILVGLDLAFTGDLIYADGVVPDREYDPSQPAHFYDAPLMRTDIHGDPVRTLWKWLAEAEWIGRFSERATLLNATGGGLPIPGVPNVPMPSFNPIPDLRERIDACLHPLQVGDLERPLAIMRMSLERSYAKLQKLQTLRSGSGESALIEVELEEEPAWEAVLATADFVYRGDDRLSFLQKTVETVIEFLH